MKELDGAGAGLGEPPKLAFFTLAVLKAPAGDPAVQGFMDRIGAVYADAEGSAGFLARSIRDLKIWEHSWGPVVAPTCVPEEVPLSRLAMTLTLWRDLDSVAAFAYRGHHLEAFRKRSEWVVPGPWPSYAAWWVEGTHRPNWREAVDRLDHLHIQGPTPKAFSLRQPFDADGAPAPVKGARPLPEGP